jgi:zeaxanthin glucosyltransferase
LEPLINGVPLEAIPITDDQPDVAVRVASTGTVLTSPRPPGRGAVKAAVDRVMNDPGFRRKATLLRTAVALTVK